MRFTKEDLADELRLVLMATARQIDLSGGTLTGHRFLGLEASKLLTDENARFIDLSGFPIWEDLIATYDYAMAPALGAVPPLEAIDRASRKVLGLPGNVERKLLAQVTETALARHALERGEPCVTLSLREIALLGDMTEGAVRNAACRGELVTVPRSKPVAVLRDDARAWLAGRRGFQASGAVPAVDTAALLAHCRAFIEVQRIECSETIYQTDRVGENAYEFIEGVCRIVGYRSA